MTGLYHSNVAQNRKTIHEDNEENLIMQFIMQFGIEHP